MGRVLIEVKGYNMISGKEKENAFNFLNKCEEKNLLLTETLQILKVALRVTTVEAIDLVVEYRNIHKRKE